MPRNNQPTYKVGFGKPPEHSRFHQGVSGNPNGRPRGRRNLATVLARTLQEPVTIKENGVRKTVTKLEAAVRKLVDLATSGDLAALRQLAALANSAEGQAVVRPTQQMTEADLKVMQGVLKRIEGKGKGEGHDS